ncbi:hypothetical protein [Ancylobacter sp.]
MLFLAFELWPYLAAALAIGLATGWWGGCTPARAKPPADDAGRVTP